MFDSLKKISSLPEHTKIYCGHEYTLSNLRFALEADPGNKNLIVEYDRVSKLSDLNTPSIPTSLTKELKVNPFLRCNNLSIKNIIKEKFNLSGDDLETFTALRKWKDNF